MSINEYYPNTTSMRVEIIRMIICISKIFERNIIIKIAKENQMKSYN